MTARGCTLPVMGCTGGAWPGCRRRPIPGGTAGSHRRAHRPSTSTARGPCRRRPAVMSVSDTAARRRRRSTPPPAPDATISGRDDGPRWSATVMGRHAGRRRQRRAAAPPAQPAESPASANEPRPVYSDGGRGSCASTCSCGLSGSATTLHRLPVKSSNRDVGGHAASVASPGLAATSAAWQVSAAVQRRGSGVRRCGGGGDCVTEPSPTGPPGTAPVEASVRAP